MPIRNIPLDQVTEADIAALKERGVREDETLEYKQALDLASDKGKFELLKDVSALANASGGVLLYGVEQGDGDDAGRIVALPGLEIDIDKTLNTIDQLLHDGIDERIPGIRHRAIQRSDRKHYLVIRVPPSHLAPHMVRINFPSVRFYQRGATTNQPMNARQIKEASLRAATAIDRARAVIADRLGAAQKRAAKRAAIEDSREGPDQALLHVIPVFGPIDSLDLVSDALVKRLTAIPVFGHENNWADHRFAFEGLYRELKVVSDVIAYNLFLRNGAIEFQQYDILNRETDDRLLFYARNLEEDVISTIKHVQGLTVGGILALPTLIGLSILDAQGSVLHPAWTRRSFNPQRASELHLIAIDPILVTDWGDDPAKSMKRIFDMMWQAWGWPASGSYGEDGVRKKAD